MQTTESDGKLETPTLQTAFSSLISVDAMISTNMYQLGLEFLKRAPSQTWSQRARSLLVIVSQMLGLSMSQQLVTRLGPLFRLCRQWLHERYVRRRAPHTVGFSWSWGISAIRVTVDNLPPMMLNSSAFDNYLRATVGLDVDDGKLAPGLRLHKLSSDAWVTVYKNLYTSHIYYQLHVADVSPLLQHRNTTDDNTYLCYVNSLAYAKVSNIQFTETDVQRVPLYETLQLKMVYQRVKDAVSIKERRRNFPTPTLVLKGPPGVGKSHCFEYLCQRLDGFVPYRVSLLQATSFSIQMVLTAVITWGGNVKRGRSERKVIFLDELDKYLDIVKAEEAAKSVAATGRGAALTHKRVLQELMSFIDSGQDVLVVMACNNFDKLFEGEETHYAALRSRFIEVDFAPFQRTDICGYLRYMNECMRDVERAYCHDLERHLEVLDTNAVAAARHLDHLLVLHTFDYGKIVDDVNNQVPTTTQSAPQSAL